MMVLQIRSSVVCESISSVCSGGERAVTVDVSLIR